MAGCQFTESEKKEFVILNTRKPISPLNQVLELSFSRLAMSLVEQVLPLLPDPVPGSHLLCHHSPCLQWGWLSSSFFCSLTLALILPENKILKKFRNYFDLKKLPGKYSISLNTSFSVHMSARLPLYFLILGRPGHWDVDVLSSSPLEILVHHRLAGWNTTSLSLKKKGFVILNIRSDRSGCQTGEHVVCHCVHFISVVFPWNCVSLSKFNVKRTIVWEW